MKEFPREFFKTDPFLYKIWQIIMSNHKAADHTAKNLFENRHIKDFCENARHFIMIPNPAGTMLYAHYDCGSWWNGTDGALVKIDSIGIYESFLEYENARIKQLHNAKNADIPNIN